MIIKEGYLKGLEIEFKNKVNIIYGSNGTGKTSLSKVLRKEKDYFVFNEDFIRENVFITTEIATKSVGNEGKKERLKLLLSNTPIKINDCITEVDQINNELIINVPDFENKNYENSDNDFYRELAKDEKDFLLKEIDNIKKNIGVNFLKQYKETIKGHKKWNDTKDYMKKTKLGIKSVLNYYDIDNYKSNISDSEISDYFSLVKNYSIIKNFVEKFKQYSLSITILINKVIDDILNFDQEIIFDLGIKKVIKSYKEKIFSKVIKSDLIENSLNNLDSINGINKWIKEGVNIHENYGSFCFYCENDCCTQELKLMDDISKFNESSLNLMKEKAIKSSEELKDFLKKYEDIFSTDVESTSDFITANLVISNEFDKFIDFNSNLVIFNEEIIELIKSGVSISSEIKANLINRKNTKIKCSISVLSKDFEKNKDLIITAFIRKNKPALKEYIENKLLSESIIKGRDRLKEFLNESTNLINSELQNKYEELQSSNISKIIPLEFKISEASKSSKGEGNQILEIFGKNDKIDPISEISAGQRSMLALIIFLIQVDKKIQNNEKFNIVYDDPVDGMDYYSFITTAVFIESFLKKLNGNVLVMTHNYDFVTTLLYSMPEEDKCLMKLTYNKTIEKPNVEEILHSDLAIFSNLTNYIISNNDKIIIDDLTYITIIYMILMTKIIDNKLFNIIEMFTGKSLEPKKEVYSLIKEKINNNKEIKNLYPKLSSFIDSYLNFRHINEISLFKRKYDDFDNINLLWKNFCDLIALFEKTFPNENFIPNINKLSKLTLIIKDTHYNLFDYFMREKLSFPLKQLVDSAKVMLFKKVSKNYKDLPKEVLDKLSNSLRHSSYSISNPLVSYDYEPIIELIKKGNRLQ